MCTRAIRAQKRGIATAGAPYIPCNATKQSEYSSLVMSVQRTIFILLSSPVTAVAPTSFATFYPTLWVRERGGVPHFGIPLEPSPCVPPAEAEFRDWSWLVLSPTPRGKGWRLREVGLLGRRSAVGGTDHVRAWAGRRADFRLAEESAGLQEPQLMRIPLSLYGERFEHRKPVQIPRARCGLKGCKLVEAGS